MFSFRRTRGGLDRTDRSADRKMSGFPWRKVGDSVLVVAAIIVTIYTISVAAQALDSYTVVRNTPVSLIRLQVVDASGQKGLLAVALDDVRGLADESLAVKVVETTDFDLREVDQSYLVSRDEDCRAARILAERLGLDPDDVEYKPLTNNRRQVTATLILGMSGVKPATNELLEEET